MLWNDGHLSGYFAYRGRVFSVNHMGGDIHTVAELELPPDHTPGPESGAARPIPPEPKVASRSPGFAAAATTASTRKVASVESLRIRFAACLTSANTRTTVHAPATP